MKNKPLQKFVNSAMDLIPLFDFSKPKNKGKKNIWLKKVSIRKDFDINALKK